DAGNIGYQEMFQTFNMGVGFVVVCRQRSADRVIQSLRTDGLKPSVIGSVEEGHGVTLGEFGVHYDSY
ncbi:MAG: phosphoribosylformylglycinamidine cyclo-ligase, partial [Thermoplasmata archaeon]|nr:phosphoribosylformylglycinamidine cyclo-ligase [Candidatus Sysuiplasma superficiale]